MSYEFILQLVSMAVAAAVGYAAIRADLVKAMHKAESAGDSAAECHARLDRHIELRH